jgi:methyltransferase-like protein
MDLKKIFEQKSNFATRYVGEELILVPVKANVTDMNEIFTLNEVGSFIWKSIDGKSTEEDISKAIAAEFDIDIVRAGNDLGEFIESLYRIMK